MALFRAESVIIKVKPFGEADKILTVFSLEEGKFDVIAKGARRPKSRFAGITQPFFHVELSAFRGKNIDTLSQADVIETYSQIASDLIKMAFGSYVHELLDKVMEERDRNETVFRLLLKTQQELCEDADPLVTTLAYELKLISICGFRPELSQCVLCGEEGDRCFKLSPESGGIVCEQCAQTVEDAINFPQRLRLIWAKLIGYEYDKLHSLVLSSDERDEAERSINVYVDHKIDRKLNSRAFLNQVRGLLKS